MIQFCYTGSFTTKHVVDCKERVRLPLEVNEWHNREVVKTVPTMLKNEFKKIDGHVDFLGVRLFSGSFDRALTLLSKRIESQTVKKPLIVFTPTTEQIVLAKQDDIFCSTLNSSSLNVPDTVGVVWGSRWLTTLAGKRGGMERIPGVDLMDKLCHKAAKSGWRVFLLGGAEGVAVKAVKNLKQKYPGLQAEGFDGPQDARSETAAEFAETKRRIEQFKAEVVFVALGAPEQELWVCRHAEELPAKVLMVVGGALDVFAGIVPRAPLWWRKIGLEWWWRLIHQPWRWRRQLKLLTFLGLLAQESVVVLKKRVMKTTGI